MPSWSVIGRTFRVGETNRTVAITDHGRRAHAAAQAAVRTMEDEILRALTPTERKALFTALPELSTAD